MNFCLASLRKGLPFLACLMKRMGKSHKTVQKSMLKINHILQTNLFHHIKRNSARREQDLLTTWVCSSQIKFCVCWDVVQFYISSSSLSATVASVFTSLRAFCKVCSTHSSPHIPQAVNVFWKQPEYHGPTKHSTATAEVPLKLNQNISLVISPPPTTYTPSGFSSSFSLANTSSSGRVPWTEA